MSHLILFSKKSREILQNVTCFLKFVASVSIKHYRLKEPLVANGRLVCRGAMAAGMCRSVRRIDCDEAEEELKFTKRLRVFRHNEIYSHVVNSNVELCSH